MRVSSSHRDPSWGGVWAVVAGRDRTAGLLLWGRCGSFPEGAAGGAGAPVGVVARRDRSWKVGRCFRFAA